MAHPSAIIAPSVLASDFSRLKEECESVLSENGGKVEWLHLDVMDGHFVPNMTFGPPVIKSLRSHLKTAYFDCHLMISEPAKWVQEFAKAGVNQYTFHIEATSGLEEAEAICNDIKKHNMHVGISLKPKTPLSAIESLCDKGLVDTILVMTVEPGFGGQKFMGDMMPKVAEARKKYPNINIEVDGGIGPDETIQAVAKAGANAVVAGTSIFGAKDRASSVNEMRKVLKEHLPSKL